MSPLAWVTRLAAVAAHEVIAEYRRLDAPPPAPPAAAAPVPARDPESCTQARSDARWQPSAQPPASPFGFGPGKAVASDR